MREILAIKEMRKVESVDISTSICKNDLFQIVSGLLVYIDRNDIKATAQEMISSITDTSWISNLEIIEQISYRARAEGTINLLANEIFSGTESEVTADFGEYLISMTAQDVLEEVYSHTHIPLAELWKEKISKNPGFDFHTLSPEKRIIFGEAKYSASDNPHYLALSQIKKFLSSNPKYNKHLKELSDLKILTNKVSVEKVINGDFGIAAAFSIIDGNEKQVLEKASKSKPARDLAYIHEIYLIGIKLYDNQEK